MHESVCMHVHMYESMHAYTGFILCLENLEMRAFTGQGILKFFEIWPKNWGISKNFQTQRKL